MDFGTLAMLFPMLLLLLGLGAAVVIDPYIRREHRHIMLAIVALCLSLVAQNYLENVMFISHSHFVLKNFLAAYGYSVRPVIPILFLNLINLNGKKWINWSLAGINAALYFTSPFSKLCFYIREFDYATLRGPLWFSCFLVSAVLLVELLVHSAVRYRETRKREHFIPVFIALSIIISVTLDMSVVMEPQTVSFLTIAVVVGSVFYYIWLHLQFVREHENDLMAAQRIQIMMTQIQPHFIFNALNTIRALYAKDPSQAERTLENFSTYLRENLESLSQTDLIPFSKEIEHTRLYAEIEAQRFPNIRTEYMIEDENFMIPSLIIQPLVENAIRHGVRGRTDALVTVSTVREPDIHRITVSDNGAGFDPIKQETDEKSHIGIRNVKERVERMCGGKMILQSEIGKGTCVTLLIPDGAESEKKEKRK